MNTQSTPNYIITYRALDKNRNWEDGTVLSPTQDYAPILEGEGYRKISIISTKVNK